MANATNTLAGILNLGDANVDIEVSDLLQDTPFLNALVAVPSTHGHNHKYNRETVAAGQGFRAIGSGLNNTAGQIELVTETLKFLDASWIDDIAAAKAMSTGKGGVDAWVAQQTRRSLRAGLVGAEKQVIYGDQTPGATAGFTGLVDFVDSGMVVDAGGSTADSQTSVWAVRNTMDDFAVVYNGDNDGALEVSEVYKTTVTNASSETYTAFRCDIDGYLGTQAGSKYTVGRLANVETALDDDDLGQLYSLFPASRKPTHWVMNRKALRLLRESRTATNERGEPAPFPTTAYGLPIVVTDQIISTEAVVA